jgi:hypothetical protein
LDLNENIDELVYETENGWIIVAGLIIRNKLISIRKSIGI